RARLRDIQRFPLRQAFDDVEHHHITEFLQPDEKSQRAADLATADERDFVAGHECSCAEGDRILLTAPAVTRKVATNLDTMSYCGHINRCGSPSILPNGSQH